MNQLAGFNQICMDITLGHDEELSRLLPNFQGHCMLKLPNLSQKVLLCTLSHEPFAEMLLNLHVYIIGTGFNSSLDFGDLDLIFKVTVRFITQIIVIQLALN